MLRWILNRYRRKRAAQEREIFRYWSGHDIRVIDPIEAIRGLMNSPPFDWSRDPVWIQTALTQPERDAALQRTVTAIRRVFHLPGSDREGLTESECVGLLIAFVTYIREQKKSGNVLLTSLLSTDSPPSVPQSDPIQSADSDCGSTSNADNTAQPCPS